MQPPSKMRSSLAPAGTKAGSPVGAGNPGSSAKAVTANAKVRPRAATDHVKRYQLLIAPPVMTNLGPTTSSGSTGGLVLTPCPTLRHHQDASPPERSYGSMDDCSSLLHAIQ